MPCDTIQLNQVQLDAEKMAPALLAKALTAIGAVANPRNLGYFRYQGNSYEMKNGQLQSTDANVGAVADLVRRAYSAEVLKYAAVKNGWKLQQTGAFAYNVIRS